MKTLLLLLAIAVVGCTPEPITNKSESYNYPQIYSDCGLIVTIGEDQRGDYIIVQMHGSNYKTRYKVPDYQVYQLNTQICNFDGLTKQPL